MSDTNDNYEQKIKDGFFKWEKHTGALLTDWYSYKKGAEWFRDTIHAREMAKKDKLYDTLYENALKEHEQLKAEIERLRGLLKESDCVHPYSCIDFREDGDNFCKACGEKLT